MLYLGRIKTRADLPSGLIPRSEAAKYYDLATLQPMLPIVENLGFIKYHATMHGKDIEYLDIKELQKWGEANDYDFRHSSGISYEWREYLRKFDRIYADVARLNALALQMEFDDEDMRAIPVILSTDEYLKAGNGYLVEMAHKTVITETPFEDGGYASIEAIHQHSIEFEKTVVCGIYFLIGEGAIRYVGQSIDILKRIREHRQTGQIEFDRFSMLPVRREKLTEVETWYIRHFRPAYNKTRMRPFPAEKRVQRERESTERRLRKKPKATRPGMPPIFFDIEFTDLAVDPQLISIGLVSEDGTREFYAELSDTWQRAEVGEFARTAVLPQLECRPEVRLTMAELRVQLGQWIQAFEQPVQLATDSMSWDWPWIHEIFDELTLWPPNLDGKPLLLTMSDLNDYDKFIETVEKAFADGLRRHHALDDAKANRLGWIARWGQREGSTLNVRETEVFN